VTDILDSATPGSARGTISSLFPAKLGRFEAQDDRELIDGLSRWVKDRFRAELSQRPSCHAYVATLPAEVVARIDRLRDSPLIRDLILREAPAGSGFEPMKHTDELYISHYNKDRGGDQGLFDKHYDGNLRFLSSSMVVRALIYLQSDASYTVVFGDSRVEKAFTTYEFGLLDFHRELHWVEGSYTPGAPQRILLKCNYLVTAPGAGARGRVALAANTAVFYVVKAAMEYSKSPRTPAQKAVGYLCNLFRRLNIVHPLVPFAVLAAAAMGVAALGHFVVTL